MSNKSNKVASIPRSYNFCAVYYLEDSAETVRVLKELKDRGTLRNYYFIQHQPDEDNKQVHFHFCIEFYTNITLSACNKKFPHLRDGKIEICQDFIKYLRYLRHLDDPQKIQYENSDVVSSDILRYIEKVSAKTPDQASEFVIQINRIQNYIIDHSRSTWSSICVGITRSADFDTKIWVNKNAYFYRFWEDVVFKSERGFSDVS